MPRWPRFWRDTDGAIGVMGASVIALGCLLAAVVVDGGSMALEARRLQGAADLAALSAARDLPRAQAAAQATARANAGASVRVQTVVGLYRASPEIAPGQRFSPAPVADANAARVTVSGAAPLWFGRLILGRDALPMARSASAAVRTEPPMAMFSIGSRLARLDGGLANQVLGGLAGGEVSLTLMDYRGLAEADVSLLAFTDALATHVGVSAGAYDQLLASEIDAGEALRVLERVTEGGAALERLAHAAQGRRLRLGEVIGLETDSPAAVRDGLAARVSALDLAAAMLEVAGGERQVALDLGARAGLADLDAWLAIGERPHRSPWLTVTRDGQPVIRTAQARLYLEARTSRSLAGLAQVRVPLLVELASAEARLEDIRCGEAPVVHVGVRPGVARARIGAVDRARLDDFKTPLQVRPAELIDVLGLVRVRASADIEAADTGFGRLAFTQAAIAAGTPQTTHSTGFTSGLVASLLSRLELDVDVIGLGLGLGDLAGATGRLLNPLGPVLDGVVDGLLSTLGLSLGEADVTVHAVVCPDRARAPVLVG